MWKYYGLNHQDGTIEDSFCYNLNDNTAISELEQFIEERTKTSNNSNVFFTWNIFQKIGDE